MNAPSEKPMVEHALALRERGLHVFPIAAGEKEPPLIRAFQDDATRDPKRIAHLWKQWPTANIGVSTSRFGRDKALLVVDVDVKAGKAGDQTMAALIADGFEFPATFTQRTPTGGMHLVYVTDAPVRQGVDVLGVGLDIRSAGGYILGAGSIIGDATKLYVIENDADPVPAPAWMIERCGAPRERASNADIPRQGIDAELATQRALDYLAAIEPATQGGRNDAGFRVAAKLRDFGVSQPDAESLMSEHWRCEPPLAAEELAHVVESAFRYAKNQAGVDAPESYFEAIEPEEQAQPVAEGAQDRAEFPGALPIATHERGSNPPSLRLVKGVLRHGGLSLWVGDPDAGKTTILMDLGLAVAHGVEWMGRRVARGAVLMVCFERYGDVQGRLDAYYTANPELESQPKTFGFVNLEGRALATKGIAASIVETARAFEKQCGVPVALVLVDTLSAALTGDENDSGAIGDLLRALKRIKNETGAHIAVSHHYGKSREKGARGHSKLAGDFDALFSLADGIIEPAKLKSAKGWRIGYEIQPVTIGIDEDGDAVTAPVARSSAVVAADFPDTAWLDPASTTGRVLEALRALAAEAGAGTPVALGQWRKAASPEIPESNRSRDFKIAVRQLKAEKHVTESPTGFFRPRDESGATSAGRIVH
jgi:hypothetical protein